MHYDAVSIRRFAFRKRTPDVHGIACSGEASSHKVRVIANTTRLRRVFAGNDVPRC